MNRLKGEYETGIFVPCHYAGVFTGLFNKQYWYRITQHQNETNEYTIVEYYPSNVSIDKNIHELSRRQEADRIRQLELMVEEKTKMLQDLVREISSPLIPVLEGIVVVPLIGSYEEDRAEDLIVTTLEGLGKHKTNFLLLDLTGLKEVSQYTSDMILKLGSAASLLGIEVVLVGISAELALVITQTMSNLRKFECLQTLQHGIYYALGKSGRSIV